MPKRKQDTNPAVVDAVKWIAANDAPGDDESPGNLASYLTVGMVADLYGASAEQIAELVYLVRHPGYKVRL